jgi:hypothetical protein
VVGELLDGVGIGMRRIARRYPGILRSEHGRSGAQAGANSASTLFPGQPSDQKSVKGRTKGNIVRATCRFGERHEK